jgi:hypothetical protein
MASCKKVTIKLNNSGTPPICLDATIELNGTEVGTVASGGMLNTAVENEDGTPLGSFIDGVWVVPNCPPPIVPSGVLFQSPVCLNPTQYSLYDEGWLFANGYFDDIIPINPLYKPTLDTSITNYWYKLKENMPVNGNSNMMRFVDVDGGQTFSATGNKNLIMIDKFTGLGIYREMIAPNTQQILMDNSQTFSITVNSVVYDDWHLITLDELMRVLYGFLGQNVTVTDPITANVITSLTDLPTRLLHTSSTLINTVANNWQYQPINCTLTQNVAKTTTTRGGIYVTKQIRNLIGI